MIEEKPSNFLFRNLEIIMIEKEITIHNPLGFDVRFAQMLSEAANQFSSNIYIQEGQMKASAKNVMGIMVLAARKDTQLTITAEGPDEEEAIEVLSKLVESGFDEVIHLRV